MPVLVVSKRNIDGQETWSYKGELIEFSQNRAVLEAFFDREDRLFHGMPLFKGDRFIEVYFTDRWYNIYEIYAREDGSLRGWYCNISRPAVIGETELSFVDLALDLLVFPDGRQLVLDEDEFGLLKLSETEKLLALSALEQLQESFSKSTSLGWY